MPKFILVFLIFFNIRLQAQVSDSIRIRPYNIILTRTKDTLIYNDAVKAFHDKWSGSYVFRNSVIDSFVRINQSGFFYLKQNDLYYLFGEPDAWDGNYAGLFLIYKKKCDRDTVSRIWVQVPMPEIHDSKYDSLFKIILK